MEETLRYVKQKDPFTYGQACLAMLTDKSLEQIIYDIKFEGPLTKSRLISALQQFDIKYKKRRKTFFKNNKLEFSKFAILFVECKTYNHMVVYKDGKYYDPEYGIISKEYTRGKIIDYIDIL